MVALILYHCSSSKCFFATHACKLLATLLFNDKPLINAKQKKEKKSKRQTDITDSIEKSAKPGNHAWVHVGYL